MATAQPALVGRDTDLATLASVLRRSADGELTVALVEGEVGIGKSRVLAEAGDLVMAQGGLALRGYAPPPAGQALPFAAVSQLLRDVLRQLPRDEAGKAIEQTPLLGHVQPAWRVAGETPAATSLTALCEQFADLLDLLARDRPLVAIAIDDLQWADPATLDFISYVARDPRALRVTLLLAARTDETPAVVPLRVVRTELLRVGATLLRLGPLERNAARDLVAEQAPPGTSPVRRDEIQELAGGNPLFLTELSRSVGTDGELPASLIALIGNRLGRLSESEQTVVRVVSIAADGVSVDTVARVIGQPPEAALADVRRLLDAQVLTRDGDGLLTVEQPLLREVLHRQALETERRRIHSAIARSLAADPSLDPGSDAARLVRLANHWLAAGDQIRALPALLKAAEASERAFAMATAFHLYRDALDQVRVATQETPEGRRLGFGRPDADTTSSASKQPAGDPMFAELRRRAADTATLAGEPDTALRWIEEALARPATERDRNQLLLARARARMASGDVKGAVADYRWVVEHEPSAAARIGLARALIAAGIAEEAVATAEVAVEMARAGQSIADETTGLLVLGTALAAAGQVDEGMRRIEEGRAVRASRASPSVALPRVSRVIDLAGGFADAARLARRVGRQTNARELAQAAAAEATRLGADDQAAQLDLGNAIELFESGRWTECLGLVDELSAFRPVRMAALTLGARVAALRGAWEPAAAYLAACEGPDLARARPADRARFALALTELRSSRRQTGAATESLSEGIALAQAAPADERNELLAVGVRVHVDGALAARAIRAAGEATEHVELARALAREVERTGSPALAQQALLDTTRAELGRLEPGSGPGWATARATWQRTGHVWWQAYAAMREGEAWLTTTGKRPDATAALRAADTLARPLEAAPLLAELEALATRGRIELQQEALPMQPGTDGGLPISQRELEVLVLIAKGLTNKEIAAELFISERTAAHHVGHIFDKLGVSSRVEAAGVAHQSGILAVG